MFAEIEEGRERKIGGDTHERTNANDFALADAYRGRNAKHLTREHVLAQHVDAVAFAIGIDRALVRVANYAAYDFRNGCEAIIAVERCVNRAAHKAAAGDCSDYGCRKPAHRDRAAVDRLLVMAIETKRRLVTEIDLSGNGFAPVTCRSSAFHAVSCSPRAGRGVPLQVPGTGLGLRRRLEFESACNLQRVKLQTTPASWHQDDDRSWP